MTKGYPELKIWLQQ